MGDAWFLGHVFDTSTSSQLLFFSSPIYSREWASVSRTGTSGPSLSFGWVSLFGFKPSHVVPSSPVHNLRFMPLVHYLQVVLSRLLVVFSSASPTHLLSRIQTSSTLSQLRELASILLPPFRAPLGVFLLPSPPASMRHCWLAGRERALHSPATIFWSLVGPTRPATPALHIPLLALSSLGLTCHFAFRSGWPAGFLLSGSWRISC